MEESEYYKYFIPIIAALILTIYGFLRSKVNKHGKVIEKHSEKITTLEANDKNREKTNERLEKAIDKLSNVLTENQKTTIDMYKLIFEKVK